ncbi:MAG: prepilin-type N-terminal cleavage/methylation domain-containing protein [Candidatus Saelkia tenebricola]|nr:prepilin-type N-terminal cleavage/methylation domain-containing protein [Candidatus Saelkia tenebricola]
MKGLTLIELIISIVIFALVIGSLMNVFATVSQDTASGIHINRASTLAGSWVELILARSFDEEAEDPFTAPGSLGPDTGESIITDYDDVDDFNGYAFTDNDYPNLSGEVAVYYVEDPDSFGNWNSVSLTSTNYKRIDVNVTHPQLGTITISNGVTYAAHNTK